MLGKARNGNWKATCGAPECLKSRARERKRAVRAKARGEAPTAPAGEPPCADDGFAAPWGETYESEQEAWADCLFTGGLDGFSSVSQAEQFRRQKMLTAVRSDG